MLLALALASMLATGPALAAGTMAHLSRSGPFLATDFLRDCVRHYGSSMRVAVWANVVLLPLVITLGLANGALARGRDVALGGAAHGAWRFVFIGIQVALFVLSRALVDLARAHLIAGGATTPLKAVLRTARLVTRTPVLLGHGLITVAGWGTTLLVVVLRARLPTATTGGILAGVAVAQLAVLSRIAAGIVTSTYALAVVQRAQAPDALSDSRSEDAGGFDAGRMVPAASSADEGCP